MGETQKEQWTAGGLAKTCGAQTNRAGRNKYKLGNIYRANADSPSLEILCGLREAPLGPLGEQSHRCHKKTLS